MALLNKYQPDRLPVSEHLFAEVLSHSSSMNTGDIFALSFTGASVLTLV